MKTKSILVRIQNPWCLLWRAGKRARPGFAIAAAGLGLLLLTGCAHVTGRSAYVPHYSESCDPSVYNPATGYPLVGGGGWYGN